MVAKKKFLISIDTEGDNLWAWRLGDSITTENAKFLPRFQLLCEYYGFKPTYLINYEMASDDFFADYFKRKAFEGKCEIAMHLHAWNNPPFYELPVRTDAVPGAPYLIEYPQDIMRKKIEAVTVLIKDRFDICPVTHRAGRWAMNDMYFSLLNEFGYKTDCSYTPGFDWTSALGQSPESAGSDYRNLPYFPFKVNSTNITEIPVTVIENHRLHFSHDAGIRKTVRKYMEARKGYGPLWFRPRNYKDNIKDLLWMSDVVSKNGKNDYLMFMLHSSELMPGGSPTFKTEEDIERLYKNLNIIFEHIAEKYIGETINSYSEDLRI